MAALYREYPGEIHVYPHRMPRANGGEPWLVGIWLLGMYGAATSSVVVFMLWYNLFHLHWVWFLFQLFLTLLFAFNVGMAFRRVVFSQKKKAAWSALLFFKWGRVPLGDITDIKVRDEEFMGKTRYVYVATRRDRFQAPLPVSARAPDMKRLSAFYHAIVPRIQDLLQTVAAGDAAEVAVEQVEVPVADAARLLSRDDEMPRFSGGETADAVETGLYFREENGVYRRSFWLANLAQLFVAVVVLNGFGLYYSYSNFAEHNSLVSAIVYAGAMIFLLYHVGRENMDIGINPRKREITFRVLLGLRVKKFRFDKLVKFTVKSVGGIHSLCMVLEDQKVDPTLYMSLRRSPARIRAVLDEICAIMELDPEEWFDG